MKYFILLLLQMLLLNNVNATNKAVYNEYFINIVSQVNPFNQDSPVEITGRFNVNSSVVDISLYVDLVNSNLVNCQDPVMVIGDDPLYSYTIKCKLGTPTNDIPTPFNYDTFYPVAITFKNQTSPTTTTLSFNYNLFSNGSCPKSCDNHGECDFGNTCRCKENFASFDCSHKVLNDSSPVPTGISFNTFKMETKRDYFQISVSHVLQQSISNPIQPQQLVSSMYIIAETSTSYGLSFTSLNQTVGTWLNGLEVLVDYTSKDIQFKFLNEFGAFLPISSTSASIAIYPTITYSNMNTSDNGGFEIVYQITNQDVDLISWEISECKSSIVIMNKKSASMLVVSLGGIYSVGGMVIPNHAYLQYLSDDQTDKLTSYDSNSVYISIVIPQLNTTANVQTTYAIQLSVNCYNIDDALPKWAIALIVIASAGVFGFIILVIVLVVRSIKRRRRSQKARKLSSLDGINGGDPIIKSEDEESPLIN